MQVFTCPTILVQSVFRLILCLLCLLFSVHCFLLSIGTNWAVGGGGRGEGEGGGGRRDEYVCQYRVSFKL